MKSRCWLRLCSLLIGVLFVVNSLGLSLLEARQPSGLLPAFSREICDVEETWLSDESRGKDLGQFPFVILLQDAHANYSAQKNVISVLQSFEQKLKDQGVPRKMTLAVEGTSLKEIDPFIFRDFPNPAIRREVSDSFLKEGEINGVESYAINANPGARIFGIDDETLYEKNVSAYQEFAPYQERTIDQLKAIRDGIEKLKQKVYSKPLLDLEESRKRLNRDMNTLGLHLRVLFQWARYRKIYLEHYPLVLKISSLIDTAGKKTRFEDEFRQIKSYEFFDQMSDFEMKLRDALVRSIDENLLVQADQIITLLEKLARFELSQREYRTLTFAWQRLSDSKFWGPLDDLLRRRASSLEAEPKIREMLGSLEKAKEFYQIASERDEVLVKNLNGLMERTGQKIIFVFAGGFHTEGMTRALKKKNISYSVLLPQADPNWDASNYWKLLGSERVHSLPLSPVTSSVMLRSRQEDIPFQIRVIKRFREAVRHADHDPKQARKWMEAYQKVISTKTVAAASLGVQRTDLLAEVQHHGREFKAVGSGGNINLTLKVLLSAYRDLFESRDEWVNNPFEIALPEGTFQIFLESPAEGDWLPAASGQQISKIVEKMTKKYSESRRFRLVIRKVIPHETERVALGADGLPQEEPETEALEPGEAETLVASRPVPENMQEFVEAFRSAILEQKRGVFRDIVYHNQGGQGIVFRAAMGEGGKFVVAIKTLQPQLLADPEYKERLKREAKALARVGKQLGLEGLLIHDLQTLNLGEKWPEVPYYTMEFLEGASDLQRLFQENGNRPLNPELAVQLIARVAQQLQVIHDASVIHRDIKPANIGLRRVEEELQTSLNALRIDIGSIHESVIPIMFDFGMVKINPERTLDVTDPLSLTQEDWVMGTAVFMSPEQAQASKYVDSRADVYSLAATLFYLITGQYPVPSLPASDPHARENYYLKIRNPARHAAALRGTLMFLSRVHWYREEPLSSPRNQKKIAQLFEMFEYSLASRKEMRYQSAREFEKALGRLLEDEEGQVAPSHITRLKKLKNWVAIHWKPVSVVLAAFFVAGAGILAAYEMKIQRQKAEDDRRKAQEDQDSKIREAEKRAKTKLDEAKAAIIAGNYEKASSLLEAAAREIQNIASAKWKPELEVLRLLNDVLREAFEKDVSGKVSVKTTAGEKAKEWAKKLDELARNDKNPDWLRQEAEFYWLMIQLNEPQWDISVITRELVLALKKRDQLTPAKKAMTENMAKRLFFMLEDASPLESEPLSGVKDFAGLVFEADFFRSFSASEKGRWYFILGRVLALQGDSDFVSALNRAVEQFDEVYREDKKEEALIAKARALFWQGLYDDSRASLEGVKAGALQLEKEILYAENLIGVGKYQEARSRLEPLAEALEGLKSLSVNKLILDTYLLEYAAIYAEYRNMYEMINTSPAGPERRRANERMAEIYNAYVSPSKEVKNSAAFRQAKSFVTQMEGTADMAQEALAQTEPDYRAAYDALEIQVLLALRKLSEASDYTNGDRKGNAIRYAEEKFRRILALEAKIPSQEKRRFIPLFQAARLFSAGPSEKPTSTSGLVRLVQAELLRIASIKDPVIPPNLPDSARVREAKAAFKTGEKAPGDRAVLRQLAGIRASEGRSLGVSGIEILKAVEAERNLSPVFLELNHENYASLIRQKRNRAQAIFLLVPDKKLLAKIRRELGNPMELWKDYRVGLIATKKPLGRMRDFEVKNTLKKSMAYLRQLFPEGELRELKVEQAVFLNHEFLENWGPNAKRIRYQAEDFWIKEDYRQAYLAAAFYYLNHREEESSLFKPDSRDPTVLSLMESVLESLKLAWQGERQVSVSA